MLTMCMKYEAKYQYLINKREDVDIDHSLDAKVFIECSNDLCDVCKNIDEYNLDKDNKYFIVFDDMITDMINNKKLKLFIRGRKLNIYLFFITQSYFKVPKDFRLNTTHFLLQKFQIKENFEKLQ